MSDDLVSFHAGDDPAIVAAATRARESFKHFYAQVAQDFHRILPALEVACVKAPFSDDDPETPTEQMWIDGVDFDGENVNGVLINEPNHLTSVEEGDVVSVPLSEISDWLCVLDETVYGAYSVQVIRSRMAEPERRAHDDAWGLNFPDPETVHVPERSAEFEETIAQMIIEELEKEPELIEHRGSGGRPLIHQEALGGSAPAVRVLLEHGADPNVTCDRGWTALDYAKSLGWDDVIALLEAHG